MKQPALMLNGRYDFIFPVESTQELFYQLLGSKKDQKKHLLYETAHGVPRNELIKEVLTGWTSIWGRWTKFWPAGMQSIFSSQQR